MEFSGWEDFPSELETLAITESSTPNKFSSKCIVTPIVTSSNFLLRGSGANCLENGFEAGSPEPISEVNFSILYKYNINFITFVVGNLRIWATRKSHKKSLRAIFCYIGRVKIW